MALRLGIRRGSNAWAPRLQWVMIRALNWLYSTGTTPGLQAALQIQFRGLDWKVGLTCHPPARLSAGMGFLAANRIGPMLNDMNVRHCQLSPKHEAASKCMLHLCRNKMQIQTYSPGRMGGQCGVACYCPVGVILQEGSSGQQAALCLPAHPASCYRVAGGCDL